MAIFEDASTPPPLMRGIASGGTATTVAFSPPAGTLVVVAAVWLWGANSIPGALSCSDSQGAIVPRIVGQDYVRPAFWWHKPFLNGTSSAFFTRYYANAPGPITMTVRAASGDPASAYIAARVLIGAAPSQGGAGMARAGESGDVSTDLWTPGSWAYCAGGRPGTAAPVPGPNTTQIGAWTDPGSNATAAVGRLTGQNTHRGVHRIGWIQNISEVSVLEVLPFTLQVPPQPVITAYEVITADLLNNWLTPASQVKTAPSAVAGTVQQPDPDLSVPVLANAYYTWKSLLIVSGAAGADMTHSFAVPAGASGGYVLRRQDASQAWGSYSVGITAPVTSYTPAAGQNGVEMDGFLYTGGNPGNLTLQWAAGGAGTATIGTGSYLTVIRAG